MKNDDEGDSKKSQCTPKPRRTVGLSRISPRTPLTPQIKRPISQIQHTQNISTPNRSDAPNLSTADNDSLVTPMKKRKSLGRFVITPKQNTDSNKETGERDVSDKTIDELKTDINQMKMHLEKYEKYKQEKLELQRLIEMWSACGRCALQQLQDEIQPTQEIEQILTHLNIPIDIFGNITNDE